MREWVAVHGIPTTIAVLGGAVQDHFGGRAFSFSRTTERWRIGSCVSFVSDTKRRRV